MVTLTGPFGTQTMSTNDNGEFLFANLLPDYYDIKAELTGFRVGNMPHMEVRVGEVSTMRVVLQSVEATNQYQILDGTPSPVNPSVTVGANIPLEMSLTAPVDRSITAMTYVAPGATDGQGAGDQNPSISGATGLENLTIIDGVNITDPLTGATGSYNQQRGAFGNGLNFDFVRQVDVKTGGYEAQYGQASGHGRRHQRRRQNRWEPIPRRPLSILRAERVRSDAPASELETRQSGIRDSRPGVL
jgi:hypothetical protein